MAAGTYIQDLPSSEQRAPTELKYRPDIDGLRALAVLAVVGFHAFPTLFRGGFIGVDVFFVISGYLISGIIFSALEKRRFSFKEFYARRIKRIFPALILVLAACFVFGWFALLADEYQRLSMHVAGGAGFVANFMLWNQTDYFNNPQRNPLTHLWSLGVEEQFYLLWPMLLWLLWRRRIHFLAVALLIGISSFIFNVGAFGGRAAAFYLPGSRLWELLLGSVLAYLTLRKADWLGASRHDSKKSTVLQNLTAAVGILLIVAGIALISKEKRFPGWWALLPTAGTYLIVSAGPKAWLNRNVLANRVLVWIGLISYPLYLWHWPLLSFASILEGQLPILNVRMIVVPVSFALAALTYILVEKPIRFGGYVRAKVTVLCLLMALIGCAGYATYRLNGLESRSVNRLFNTNLHQLEWFNPDRQCLRLAGVEAEYRNRQAVFCSMQDQPDAVQVAIIGDSTANALYPGFEKIFKQKQIGVINIGNGTCAPFRGLHGVFDWNRDCGEINDKIYNFLLRNSQIRIVVMGLAAWDIKNMQFDGLPANASLDARFAALSELMDKDLRSLENAGKKVVVTYDAPLFSIDPRRCVRRGIYWQQAPDCIFSEQQLVEREPYISHWRALLANRKDVCVFEQSPLLQIDGRYEILSPEGILLYRDDHHLSYFGSDRMAQEFIKSPCSYHLGEARTAGLQQGTETGASR